MSGLRLRKYLVTNGSYAMLVCVRYDHSLSMYNTLFKEAKKSFPELKKKNVECFHVTKSSSMKGCPLIKFPISDNVEKEGWSRVQNVDIDVW